MSRQTDINVRVNTQSAVTGIRTLKKAFEQLNATVKQTVGKNETIKINLDFGGVDLAILKQFSSGLRTLNKHISAYEQNLQKLNQTGTTVNLVQNHITNNIRKTGEEAAKTGKKMAGYAAATAMTFKYLSGTAKDLMRLTDSTYALGVAGQMNLESISKLRTEFISMASEIPVTALGLSEAVNNLIRTGRGFEESKQIIKEVAMLSVATGDNLAESAQIATKVMVALDINASRTTETLNTMHSTAITTASDMKYLADAFKSVAGTASVLVKSSGKSGAELDNYKQQVLDLTMAMTGSLANLGLGASVAGNKIKVLFGKLSAGEKSARSLFDEAMRVNDIRVDGNLFNFDKLAEMARTDLPRAVELMSELYVQGKLSTQVMQKMFTGRHFMEASNLFLQVNGNVQAFTESITKNNNYLTDYYKSMFNINNQFELLLNNIKGINTTSSEVFLDGVTGSLTTINNLLASANKGETSLQQFGRLILDMGAGTAQVTSLGIAFGLLTKGVIATKASLLSLVSTMATNPIALTVMGVASAFMLVNAQILKAKKQLFDVHLSVTETEKKFKSTQASLDKSTGLLNKFHETIKEIGSVDIISTSSVDIIKGFLANGNAFAEMLEGFESMNVFDMTALKNEENLQSSRVEKAKKEYADLLKLRDEHIQTLQKEYNLEIDRGVETEKTKNSLKRMMSFYVDLHKINATAEQKSIALEKKRQELGVSSWNQSIMIGKFTNAYLDDIDKRIETQLKNVQGLETQVSETINKIINEQTENQKRRGQILAEISKTQLETLQKFGSIRINGNLYEGAEALIELVKDSSLGTMNSQLDLLKSQLTEIDKGILSIKKDKTSLSSKDKEELYILEQQKKEIEGKKERAEEYLKYRTESLRELNSSLFEGVEYNKSTRGYMLEILLLTNQIKEAEKAGKTDKDLQEMRALLQFKKEALALVDEEVKQQAQRTSYQIKYKNYLKESLALELESLKIGRTKGEQAILEYSYKAKQFELDKKMAMSAVEATKATLDGLKMEQSMRDKINQITSVSEGQKFIDEFYAKYKNVLKGKEGESHKNIYEAVNSYLNALSKAEDVAQKIELLPLASLRKNLDELPNLIKSSLESLQGLADKGITPYNNYGEKVLESMMDTFRDNKDKVFKAYGIVGDSVAQAITNSVSEINVLKALEGNTQGITQFMNDLKKKIANNKELAKQLKITGDVKKDYATVLEFLISKNKDLNELSREGVTIEEQKLKVIEAQLSVVKASGDLLSKLGQITGVEALSQLGSSLNAFQDFEINMSELNIDWNELLKGSNLKENLSQAFAGALEGLNLGNVIGGMMSSTIGGGQSAQAGGSLGGMIAGLAGMTGPAGIAMAVGGSLIGGLFDKGDKGKAEAERRTKEANKIYNANTEALQRLSQNMTNLSGGVDGLNTTLISAFSKIPTIDNLGNVTTAMKDLYKTMEKTRIFESASYQVTKTKSGKSGIFGIGAKAGKTWTETYQMDVNALLRQYGSSKNIDDLSAKEISDFAKWLKTYKKGDSSNFDVLAGALSDYAESLNKMETNIENFFRDTTMEAFQGISSLQQEDLRKQIEDFYKNLGLTIDKETQKEIDKLAEEMSVMVTVMHDVRGEFLKSWRETGQSAGKVFLSSMAPYVDSMLSNISQLYYDIYFSSVNSELEKEFKNLSEKLVELKKQGQSLDWNSVTTHLSSAFDKVLSNIIAAKDNTESFNNILLELQDQALKTGLSLSEIFNMGLMSGTQKDVMESFKSALTGEGSDSAMTSIGNMLGDKLGNAMADKMIDNLLSDKILSFSSQIDKVMSGNMGFDSLYEIANQSLQIGLMMEGERQRLEAIRDMFDFNSDIEYTTQNEEVRYDSGTSQNITQIFNVATNLEVSNLVESDSIDRLANDLLETMIDKLRDKGIVLS